MILFDYNPTSRKAQIICDEHLLKLIRNNFSVKNEAARFAKKYGRQPINRHYAITPKGSFDFGLYFEIEKFLIEKQITEITYSENFQNNLNCGIETDELWDGLNHTMRYYQSDIVSECLKSGRGVCILATGGGKSLIQANLIENFKRNHKSERPFKCILLVPGLSLVEQMQKDFKEYGVNFEYSGWTGTSPLQDTEVIICNIENVGRQFGDHPWIMEIDLLLGDEAHRYNKSSNISKIVSKIKTPNKFGFTGTLSKDKLDQWKTIGIFGPIIYEKNSKELRDENFISNVVAKIIKLIHPKIKITSYQQELDYIYNCDKRNILIKKIANKLTSNTLILVNHLEHGENLLFKLSELTDKEIFFVKGETNLNDRVDIIESMEIKSNIVCIAMSSIFATGINVKNIHNIIFAAGGKSFIRIVQGIGRGLRLHKDKNRLTLIDLYDNVTYSTKHNDERKTIYDSENIKWSETEIQL